jgi:AhpD family alkylhydroperoxidase
LGFNQAMSSGDLDPKLQERLAVAVGEINKCSYYVSIHCALGAEAGLGKDEIEGARHANSECKTARVFLDFARKIVETRAQISDEDIAQVRNQGFGNKEIVEVVGHVFLNTLTNYLNHIAGTEIDFPVVPKLANA